MKIRTPKIINSPGTAKAGDILMLTDGTGIAEWQTPITAPNLDTSIYNTNGTLSGARTLTGASNPLLFTGLSDFSVNSSTLTLAPTNRLSLKTPGFASRQGQFLQLLDQGTGEVEFGTPISQNIYNNDGSILTTRQVTITQPANLIFNGQGTMTSAATLQTVNLQATNVQMSASSNLFLSGKANIAMFTPKMWLGQAVNGQLLSVTDQNNGYVDFVSPPPNWNLYNTNGQLSGPRVVFLNNQTLTLQGYGQYNAQGLGNYDVDTLGRVKLQTAGELDLAGQTTVRIRTPKVQSATPPSIGHVLAISGANGQVEFAPLPATPATLQTEYHADLYIEFYQSAYYGRVVAGTISPLYTGDLHNPPPYSRWIFRITTLTSGYNGGPVDMTLTQTVHEDEFALARSGDMNNQHNPGKYEIAEGYILETVFVPNFAPVGRGTFVMVNSGWSGAPSVLLQGRDALLPSDEVLSAGIKFSLPAVVDVLADVAGLPLNFKKVETLGRLAVGDGEHAGYYQTTYDPNAPIAEVVRSSVDMNRMWRKLILKP
jgi:hypothetical protein